MKLFKDYPEDLQEIVKIVVSNSFHVFDSTQALSIKDGKVFAHPAYEPSLGWKYRFEDYEKCRAAYLHETAGDAKASEVDWRELCSNLLAWLETAKWVGLSESEQDCADDVISEARKALERTK